MPYTLDDKLVVGISSRALFDLDEADRVFRTGGLGAYRTYQREHEDEPLPPGSAFPLVRALLSINAGVPEPLVEVIVMSRNDADTAMRIFNSIEASGLDITRGAFRGGRDPWACLKAFRCSLFLSAEPADVFEALKQGFPAALVLDPPTDREDDEPGEVRVAFDADAVLFDDESEMVFQRGGLDAFQAHEAAKADVPMSSGPFRPFLEALARLQARFPEGQSPIRTAIVTARGAPAHRRVVTTLRDWNLPVDETFFLGGLDKSAVLQVLRPHIFFDDQMRHLERAAATVPSARVLGPVHQLELFARERAVAAGTTSGAKAPPAPRAVGRGRSADPAREPGGAARARVVPKPSANRRAPDEDKAVVTEAGRPA